MKNSFTEYLIKNGWKEINAMTFQQEESQKQKYFFPVQIKLKYI